MSYSVFTKLSSLRKLSTVPQAGMVSLSLAMKLSIRPPTFHRSISETEQCPPDSGLMANLYQPGHENWSGKKAYEKPMSVQSVIREKSSSNFNKLASSQRMLSKVFTVPHAVSDFLVSTPARKISFHYPTVIRSTSETGRRPPDSVLLATLYQPGQEQILQQPEEFNVGQDWPRSKLLETQNSMHDLLRDFLGEHIGLDSLYFDAMFWKFLTSDQRFKDLGVYYKPAPIPDKNEWKASWCHEGKPNWLGNVPTQADDFLCHTAIIDGFLDKKGGKGGYAVIFIDNYARPKVAVVGFSSNGSLIFYELQGIRAALQLALDKGFGPNIQLTYRSPKIGELFTHFSDFEDVDTIPGCGQTCSMLDHDIDNHICLACEGLYLHRHFNSEEDFEILYPIIKEILELRRKLGRSVRVSPNLSQASVYLGKCVGNLATQELKQFQLLDGEHELYEMVIKPEKFTEELKDILYDDCFKGYRHYGQGILEEEVLCPSRICSAPSVFKDMRHMRRYLKKVY